jgi:hypothetical protein
MLHQGSLRACFDKNVAGATGSIVVGWTIGADGHVIESETVNSSFGSPALEACLLSELDHWEFPESGAETRVAAYPFKYGIGK